MKKILALILCFAMVQGMVVPVSAATSAAPTATDLDRLCSCGCGMRWDAVEWKKWDPNLTGGKPLSGHYYLEADYTHSKQYQVDSGVRVVIDLRGHKLCTEGSRLLLVYGYTAVLDTVGGGLISANATGTANGGAVMVAWDGVAMNDEMDATFELFDCTATLEYGKSALNGGVFSVGGSCKLRIYNCKILSAAALERGGAIYNNANSIVELKDTEIYGCYAGASGGAIFSNGSVTMENCKIGGNEAAEYGGCIYSSNGKLTVKKSVLESNISNATQNGGGNIYAVNGGTINMTSSTVRNGYAATNGGNIFLGKISCSMIGSTISGGVAGNMGGNLYCTNANANVSLNGCTVSGDMYYTGGKLTVKNKTKIGLNNNGLKLGSATAFTSSGLTDGAEIYIDDYTETASYLKPAIGDTGYCPHCNQLVSWTALRETPGGHCYLTANISQTEPFEIAADTVIDLRGFEIASAGRVFAVAESGKLTVLDSVGGGNVSGSGVYLNDGELTLRGGKHTYVKNKNISITSGSVVHNNGKLTVTGGILDGSAFSNTESNAYIGGTVYNSDGSRTLTVTGGYFFGGTAYSGGNIRISADNRFSITGGAFIGGTAGYVGGNVQISGSKTQPSGGTIQGALIKDGTSMGTSGAGNLFAGYTDTVLQDTLLFNGAAPNAYAGNISLGTNGNLTATNTVILGGSALRGGNFYSSTYLGNAAFTGCQFLLGQANGTDSNANGGNLYINHGNIHISGGQASYGKAGKNGGNIYNNGGNFDHEDSVDDGLWLEDDVLLNGGTATNGGNVYNTGDLTLTACRFENGKATAGKDIYYMNGSKGYSLAVGEGVTGTANIFAAKALFGDSTYGGVISNTAATTLHVKLLLEGQAGTPVLCVSKGKLCVGGVSVKTADSEVWHSSVESAMEACPNDGWVKLYVDSQVHLTKDCIIDLNGRTATVSGDYTLYGMDSTGDNFSVGTGKAVWADTESVKTAPMTQLPNGKRYLAVTEGNTTTYHRIELRLTHVSLRTENCGIYYKGEWGCDGVLAPMIADYGIAVSLKGMPDVDFATTPGCHYSRYDGATLQNGATRTGVIIKNIMNESLSSEDNQKRGQMPVYATAYIRLTDGTVLVDNGGIAYSLRSTMEKMDRLAQEQPQLYKRDAIWRVRDFYTKWSEQGMQAWNFNKLKQPEDDGILKIMILGSSRSVNTFQLLYQAFKDQLPDQEFVMGVMYYSGCSMTMHERFIKNDEAVYHYYRNDGGNWVITPGKKMSEGLLAENWDVVLLQAGTGDLDNNMQQETRKFLKSYVDEHVIDPYELWWHSTWFNSTDPDLYKPPKTAADAAKVDQVAQLTETNEAAVNYVLNDPMFQGHITSGTPMLYALKSLGLQDKDLFRDHTHLSDFGCLLVAYSFYAQYTGNPVTEINLNTIPKSLRHVEYQHLGDMEVTEEMKQIIIDTVDYTMKNLWSVPTGE